MAEPAAFAPGASACFELDRFEHLEGGRLEVVGRWLGIRGRRFVRPTLTLVAGGERVRLLADLEHKPWAADEGGRWRAAFAWDRDGAIEEAELAVAPDLAIRLPAPGPGSRSGERLAPARSGRDAAPTQRRERRPTARERELERELRRTHEELERVELRLRRAREEGDELARELARISGVVPELREAAAAAGAARQAEQRAIAERDAAAAERDAAFVERDRLRLERDRVAQERDRVAQQRARLIAERDRAAQAREQALSRSARPAVPPRPAEPPTLLAPTPIAGTPDPAANWWHRLIAVAVLAAVAIALAILLRVI